MIRTWPTTSVGSVSWLMSRMLCGSTSYFAARLSSVSVAATVTTRPFVGGTLSSWPMWRSVFDFMVHLFAHHRVIIDTWKLEAIVESVSPFLTL